MSNGAATDLLGQLGGIRVAHGRNWARIGAATALAIACGALFVLLYANAGGRRPVLALTRSVPAGQQLSADDFTTVGVPASPGLRPVPSSDLNTVLGRRAAVALEPDTLLTPSDLTSAPSVTAGMATIGLDLKPGEAPAGLAPGETVMLIGTGTATATASPSTPRVLAESAGVLTVGVESATTGSGDTQLTVSVPAASAPAVAAAAAAGNVAVAALGPLDTP